MRSIALGLLTAATVGLASSRPASAAPSDEDLVLTGFALAAPTYFAGVAIHEGSHALAAVMTGAQVQSLTIWPGRDAKTGAFHFGLTRVTGLRSLAQRTFFYVAPKITNTLLMAGFASLVLTNAWPNNRYGQVALSVAATGVWVDFSKDVLSFSPHNDVVKAMNLFCVNTEWRRLPIRIGYAAVAAGFGYLVYRGYRQTFAPSDDNATFLQSPQQWMLPLWTSAL
jgi:hypothetical protein